MKVVSGSTRGRSGGRGGQRGRGDGQRGRGEGSGEGRGRGSEGRGRGGFEGRITPVGNHDPRFAGRLDQQRFSRLQAPARENRLRPDDERSRNLKADPRFRSAPVDSRGHRVVARDDDDDDEEEEDDEEIDEELEDASDDEEVEEYLEQLEGEDQDDAVDDEEDIAQFEGSDVEEIDATHRIAVVNCDWDHIRAVDLFAVFFHTLPLGGRLHKVEVYLSDFGKAQLEHERQHGPDLWVKASNTDDVVKIQEENAATIATMQTEASYVEAGTPEIPEEEEFEYDNPEMMADIGEDGEVFSGGKYRQYELNRMKYYYAIAVFDSAETAAAVYRECDGMDVEASGVILDLRYVPDEESFDPSRIHNSANRLPPRYKPLKAFRAAALSQTRFKISWDQDDPHRVQSLRDAFTDDTDEANMRAYLASDTSSDEDETEAADAAKSAKERRLAKRAAIRKKYAALLADIGGMPEELPPEDDDAIDENDDGKGVAPATSRIVDDDEEEGNDDTQDDDSDDDDLNRLSDVSLEEEEEGEEEEGDDDDDDGEQITGNMEGTFDLNAGDRAQQVAAEFRRNAKLAAADLGTAERIKYKLKRKEAKQSKKETLRAKRAAEDEEYEAKREVHRALLTSRLGDSVIEETTAKAKGKKARRELAKTLKANSIADKREVKRRRAVSRLGGEQAVQAVETKRASEASEQLDSKYGRFADRLLHDPRFHVDPTSERARQDRSIGELASTVSTARRLAKQSPATKAGAKAAQATPAAAAAPPASADVDFFLRQQQPRGKRSRSAAGVP